MIDTDERLRLAYNDAFRENHAAALQKIYQMGVEDGARQALEALAAGAPAPSLDGVAEGTPTPSMLEWLSGLISGKSRD